MFKKARPARPQVRWRAERTMEDVSANGAKSAKVVSPKATTGRERRWRIFSISC